MVDTGLSLDEDTVDVDDVTVGQENALTYKTVSKSDKLRTTITMDPNFDLNLTAR